MTKEELAQQYADEIIKNHLKQIIQESFLKGYELGELHTALTIKVDGVTYVDLGLPSGTLWSSTPFCRGNGGFYERLCYNDAKNLNIPTEEQCKELISQTKRLFHIYNFSDYDKSIGYRTEMIGSTGQRVDLTSTSTNVGEGINPVRSSIDYSKSYDENRFWIKGDSNESNEALVLMVNATHKNIRIDRHFIGYKLPVFLVKNKEDYL